MISCSADDSGKILTFNYSHQVDPPQMEECLETVRDRMAHLQPGFVLLSDLTSLDWMDHDCAGALGRLMELLDAKGMAAVVRVNPDPAKDIGFNLISHFHFQRPVPVHTCENMAEAMNYLLREFPSLTAAA